MALGCESGTRTIQVLEASDLSSFHRPNDYCAERLGRKASVAGTEEVPVERLDAVFEQGVKDLETPRVLLKLDTQGYDLEVFKGAENMMREGKVGLIFVEITFSEIYAGLPSVDEILHFLFEHGFHLQCFYGFAFHRSLVSWTNALFVHDYRIEI